MSASLTEAMSGISLEDLQVGPDGKVTIANPDLAARISSIKAAAAGGPTNGSGCTSNGSHCGKKLE